AMLSLKRRRCTKRCILCLIQATVLPGCWVWTGRVQDGLADELRSVTKELYDLHKGHELPGWAGSPLAELVIDNFDDEQIWQELELQNEAALAQLRHQVTQVLSNKDIVLFPQDDEGDDPDRDDDDDDSDIDDDDGVGSDLDDKLASSGAKKKRTSGAGGDTDSESSTELTPERNDATDSDVDFDIDELEAKSKRKDAKDAGKVSGDLDVEDDFLKIDQMEAFLEAEEKRDERRRLRGEGKARNDSDDDDDEEEVDLFVDQIPFTTPINQGGMFLCAQLQAKKSSRDLKYKDYFTADGAKGIDRKVVKGKKVTFEDEEDEDSENIHRHASASPRREYDLEDVEEGGEGLEAKQALRLHVLSDDSEGEDVEDIFGGKKNAEGAEGSRSSFEKREDKLKKRIKQLEEAALSEKPWQLMGEVTAQKRPENSLLEEGLIFDHAIRMAPVITEETTMRLEDLIKQRIKDQVSRVSSSSDTRDTRVTQFNHKLVPEWERSPTTMKQMSEPEDTLVNVFHLSNHECAPLCVGERRTRDTTELLLKSLRVDCLIPEGLKSVSFHAVEGSTFPPTQMQDYSSLAKHWFNEEKKKGGEEVGDQEKTASQRKRERRLKKSRKRLKQRERQRRQKVLEEKNPGLTGKIGKSSAEHKLQQLTREGKASLLKDEGKGKALRSSQAFFTQLQEQVRTQVKSDKAKGSRKATKSKVSASKLKL
uniref:U3 small nucleolar ribonucleoprotein protein MPP10 n=1 Tax=Petromyzon marinus TaxID=7757 RepID=S4RQW0_PETMA